MPTNVACSRQALGGRLVLVGDTSGSISVLDASRPGEMQCRARWLVHRNCIFGMALAKGDRTVLTGSADATARAIDIERGSVAATFRGHKMTLRCLAAHCDNANIFLSGGRDGRICAFDTRDLSKYRSGDDAAGPPTVMPVRSCPDLHASAGARSGSSGGGGSSSSAGQAGAAAGGGAAVTALAHVSGTPLCVSGGADGHVRVWDLRMLRTRAWERSDAVSEFAPSQQGRVGWAQGSAPAAAAPGSASGSLLGRSRSSGAGAAAARGVTSLSVSPSGARLAVASLDNAVRVYRVGRLGLGPEFVLGGYRAFGFYSSVAMAPDGEAVLAASADGCARIWTLHDEPEDAAERSRHAGASCRAGSVPEADAWWASVPVAAPRMVLPSGPVCQSRVVYDVAWSAGSSEAVAVTASADHSRPL
ncbi:hypothetical protein FNF28_07572 [Cafeteria roenbergensis]|uniref:Anaphase-promoting complex subunit 4 WD40 domain-containing protein n=1 Tax=Cafeteria roenbergensis TaxID=33653 RepID=A0A5A8C316_CAFRO|nr:hypothetical protein FNF28_07572 [Cafeteria roenbergensis]